MLAIVGSGTLLGVTGHPVSVEVHVSSGLPSFTIVGLPDASCREARDRVRAALLSSGLTWPQQRITVNLAPSSLRKTGTGLDLPMAIGILAAVGDLSARVTEGTGFIGELGLDGSIRPVDGVLPRVDAICATRVVVPVASCAEAELLGRHEVRVAPDLRTLVAALRGEAEWPPSPEVSPRVCGPAPPDLADVRGQAAARHAIAVCAAGSHHLLLVGPPGAGKTMLAQRLVGVLPPLDANEALDVARIRSAAGERFGGSELDRTPPFRAPHHSASMVALVGGGSGQLRPGEISLAHGGVLFLDEMGEFAAAAVDALRQPLEEGVVRVSRAHASATMPARVLLIGATNPCPCGEGGRSPRCRCSPAALRRYARRLSGPLLDRFDLRLSVAWPDAADLLNDTPAECSASVASRVGAARSLAMERQGVPNARLMGSELDLHAPLSPAARRLLHRAVSNGRLSARGYHRVRRVARTVADLDGSTGHLDEGCVAVALALRADVDLGVGADA